jgi:PBP1b-binding outer membrane lipoprotein LpoB
VRHWFLAGIVLIAGCSQRYAAAADTRTTAAPDESFECVKRQMSSLGYKQSSIDVDEHRITGTKYNTEARRADVQFRRLVNRLTAKVGPDAGGQTSIEVESHTFGEFTTQRGPTEVEEQASNEVKEDAQKLLTACRG